MGFIHPDFIMKAITYGNENECEKQEGVSPASILYAGRIDEIQDSHLAAWGIGYLELAELLKQANGKEDEDSVCIILSDDGI
jgi:hypothetical protein